MRQYKRDGYTVFSGAHSAGIVAALRSSADRLQELRRKEAMQPSYVERDRFDNDRSWWFDEMLERDPDAVWPAVSNPQIIDFAEAVVGPFLQLDNISLAKFPSMTPAESGGKVTAWHRDSWATVPVGVYQRPLGMNTICYLQDMTEELGLLRVLPGSHVQELIIDDAAKVWPHQDEALLALKAGDVVFTHHLVYHTGTPNLSGTDRYFFAASYNITWLRQHNSFDGPNCQRIIERARRDNDRRVLRLMGIDELLLRRCNTGSHRREQEYWSKWLEEDRQACDSI